MLAHEEKKLAAWQISKLNIQISKRLKGMPIAYITGRKEFYGLDFKVNKHVLIPRPETEMMVDEALKLAIQNSQPATLLDIGTGSGCVIIALAKQISDNKFFATDISAKALAIARQNAKQQKIAKKIKFMQGDLLNPILHNPSTIGHNSLIILANLPYLTKAQIKKSPSIKDEPETALFGGKNGLELYEKLFRQIKNLPAARAALCEFDPRQTAKIKQLAKREFPKAKLRIKKDLAGLNRLAVILINQNLEP